ncbi:MAG: hypothetical protein GTO63_06855 [Anaerolineae bacterium]|nr:hypothetical protein [Anaerolineae bacterium]NIN94658.1 hypothetical protein [Anaerolineae bacterium]NIQ77723.1 hypothetical protein [Anaerolineae bacterium]
MPKRVITAGLLGGVVLIVWTFVVDGVFRLNASINMKQVAEERQVYEVLKQHIVDPGRYVVNPELTSERRFPGGEPVFSVLYGGVGHESAGSFMLVGLVVFLLAPLIGAWMLSQASGPVLSSYPRKVLFFVAIGLLFAIFTDLMSFGIGGYPIGDAIVLAGSHIVSWTLVGLVVAWRIRPEPTQGAVK